jgi:hypothetical protein
LFQAFAFHKCNLSNYTLATPELAEAARLYRESKFHLKRMLKIFAGLVCLFCVLVAAMGGVTAAVIEATKETTVHAGTGEMRVAGRYKPVTIENPHFRAGSALASIDATTAAMARAAVGDGPAVVASAFVDAFGRALSTAPLTAIDRGMVDAAGNYVRTEKKMFEDVFGGDRLTDLIFSAPDRDALGSLATLQTADVDGRSVTLAITGHAFRDFHFIRGGNASDAPLYIPAPAAASASGTPYDLAMRVLVLHTADARFPAAVAASFEPLSVNENTWTPAKNISAVLDKTKLEGVYTGLLRAVYATNAELNTSDVPFGYGWHFSRYSASKTNL